MIFCLSVRIRQERSGGAWCPKQQISKDVYEYLQIDLGQIKMITAVETQGRFGNGQVGIIKVYNTNNIKLLVKHYTFHNCVFDISQNFIWNIKESIGPYRYIGEMHARMTGFQKWSFLFLWLPIARYIKLLIIHYTINCVFVYHGTSFEISRYLHRSL